MIEQQFSGGAEIFSPGRSAAGMLFLRSGSLLYSVSSNAKPFDTENGDIELQPEAKLCEMALWISSWKHKGQLSPKGGCFLVLLDHQEFRHVACAHHSTLKHLRRYARK